MVMSSQRWFSVSDRPISTIRLRGGSLPHSVSRSRVQRGADEVEVVSMQRIFLEEEHAGPPQNPVRQVAAHHRTAAPSSGSSKPHAQEPYSGSPRMGSARVTLDGEAGRRLLPFLRQHERQVDAPVRGLDQPRRGNELRDPVAHCVLLHLRDLIDLVEDDQIGRRGAAA